MLWGPQHRGCSVREMRLVQASISQYVLEPSMHGGVTGTEMGYGLGNPGLNHRWGALMDWLELRQGQGFWDPPQRRHLDRVPGSKEGMSQKVLEHSILGVC